MCPVRTAAEIVKKIHSYNLPWDKVNGTPINSLEIAGRILTIHPLLFF